MIPALPLSYGPIIKWVEPTGVKPAIWRVEGDVVSPAFAGCKSAQRKVQQPLNISLSNYWRQNLLRIWELNPVNTRYSHQQMCKLF